MVRVELVIAGCILVVLGLILSSIGYDKLQPTTLESVVTFVEQVSGKSAPESLHASKAGGYLLLLFGAASVIAGLGVILRSRTTPEKADDAEARKSRDVQTPDAGSRTEEKSASR